MDEQDIPRLFALQARANIFETIIAGLYGTVLRPGDLAVDGGANEGLHAFPLAALVGPTGMVLAFEPIAWRAEALAQAALARGLPQLRVRLEALAERAGIAPFHWVRNADGYSGLQPRSYPVVPDVEVVAVPTVPLDALVDGDRPWRFGKLDLEGGEFRALQGAAGALRRHRPALVFECDRAGAARTYGYDADEFFGLFGALGYRLRDIFGRPFPREAWDSPGYPHYFIALHAEAEGHAEAERALPGILDRALAGAA
jgi:FkbM family methyltransferase